MEACYNRGNPTLGGVSMRYAATEEIIAIRLSEGEELHPALRHVCEEFNVDSAVVVGAVGMVRQVTFGWFNGQEYLKTDFDEVFELLALNGNVSIKDQTLYPHLHAALSRLDHTTVGGHLLRAVADHNLEVFIKPLATIRLTRQFDGWFEAIVPIRR